MLAFIDESGQPHPNDPNSFSTLVALCVQEADHRELSRQLFTAKRTLLGREAPYELKALEVLNDRTYRRQRHTKWELAERCFSLFEQLDLTTFGVVMRRPANEPNIRSDWLPYQHIFLLQRVNALARARAEQATLIYDGQGMNVQGRNLSTCISNYIFRVAMHRGQREHVVDSAFFVDSRVTPGIQMADHAAGALRLREQLQLDGDDGNFAAAIRRFAAAVAKSTRSDLLNDNGRSLRGILYLREGWHYDRRAVDGATNARELEAPYEPAWEDAGPFVESVDVDSLGFESSQGSEREPRGTHT